VVPAPPLPPELPVVVDEPVVPGVPLVFELEELELELESEVVPPSRPWYQRCSARCC
jgi:hypothetical protein